MAAVELGGPRLQLLLAISEQLHLLLMLRAALLIERRSLTFQTRQRLLPSDQLALLLLKPLLPLSKRRRTIIQPHTLRRELGLRPFALAHSLPQLPLTPSQLRLARLQLGGPRLQLLLAISEQLHLLLMLRPALLLERRPLTLQTRQRLLPSDELGAV